VNERRTSAFTRDLHALHRHVTGSVAAVLKVWAVHTSDQVEVLTAGELEIRPSEHLARARGRTLSLSVRELDLLAALARREGKIVPRAELYETVWGAPLRGSDRSVDVYVHKLRTKLAAALPEWGFIHTHFGFGYRFQLEPSQVLHRPGTSR
jgi:DNA-binding response OmpR family regulator